MATFSPAGRVLYIAESLRFHQLKRPCFKAYPVRCKLSMYAQYMHFSRVKYTYFLYNLALKEQLETIVY